MRDRTPAFSVISVCSVRDYFYLCAYPAPVEDAATRCPVQFTLVTVERI